MERDPRLSIYDYLNFSQDQEITALMKPGEKIYFCDKLSKFNTYDWKQERNFVITAERIFNLAKKTVKREILIEKLIGITKSHNHESGEFVLHVGEEYDYRLSSTKCDDIIEVISGLYKALTGNILPIFSVPRMYLKEFTTTQVDIKKKISRIPDLKYMVKEETAEEKKLGEEEEKEGAQLTPGVLLSVDEDYFMIKVDEEEESKTIYQKTGDTTAIGIEDIKIIKLIGKGAYGKVFLVQVNTGENKKLFAMKVLRKDMIVKEELLESVKSEKKILQTGNHIFLVGLECVFQTKERIHFLMKYYEGGELYGHLLSKKRFSESITKFYLAQIGLALGHLHAQSIIYRDIKLENILINSRGYLALADFGLAKLLPQKDEISNTFCGTPTYMAPEVIKGIGYNMSADWWSFGILMYELLTGLPPFMDRNTNKMFNLIVRSEVDFTKLKFKISPNAKDLIVKLLTKTPESRIGSENDIQDIMSHPFFADIDFDKLMAQQILPEYIPNGKPDPGSFEDKGFHYESVIPKQGKILIDRFQEDFKDLNMENNENI